MNRDTSIIQADCCTYSQLGFMALWFLIFICAAPALAGGDSTTTQPSDTPPSLTLPCVVPPPVEAVYTDEMIPVGDAIVCSPMPEEPIRAELGRIAESWNIPLTDTATEKSFTTIEIGTDGIQPSPAKSRSAPLAQRYLLKICKKRHGASITIQSRDDAGVFYALQSLKRLAILSDGKMAVRGAVIRDWPAFQHRGLILGFGMETEVLLNRLRQMAESKMNLLMHCGIRPQGGDFAKLKEHIRIIKDFCDAHYIEFCYLGGAGDQLSSRPLADVLREYEERYHAGIRSFTVNFDDLGLGKTLEEARQLAEQHATITNAIYRHIKALDADVRFIFCPVPYGGIAGKNLIAGSLEAGMLYLKILGEQLPPEIPFFWTGDGGVWSDDVTVAGAEAFAQACGRKAFLWDNNTIRFINQLMPLAGREAGLPKNLAGYVGNANELETRWNALSVGVVETIGAYTWNPEAYDSRTARQYIQCGREAVRERLKALAIKEVLVSGNYELWENAFDRDPATAWNSGGRAPGWIEIVFDRPRHMNKLIVTIEQSPPGTTKHEIVATFKDGSSRKVYEFSGQTENGKKIEMAIRPKIAGVTRLRLVTTESPSWVAWSEIDVLSSP